MGKVWLAMVIIFTIAYVIFVAVNAFTTKKQVTLSVFDVTYLVSVSIWSVGEGSINGYKITIAVYVALIIWFAVLCHILERNKKLHRNDSM